MTTSPAQSTSAQSSSAESSAAESTALAEAVRRMLADRAPATLLVREDGLPALHQRVDDALNHEIGLAGLLVPDDQGGLGGTLLDAAAVATELGRACAPSDFLTSTVLCGPLLADVGDPRPDAVACLVVPWDTAPDGPFRPTPGLTLTDDLLHGSVRSVAGATRADVLVVPVLLAGEIAIATLSPTTAGVKLDDVTSLDTTRPLTDLTFDASPVTIVAGGEVASAALASALDRACVALAAEQVGLASWCLATTVAHVQQRRQFGRVLGSFQALKHRLAHLWIDVDSATVAAQAGATGADPDVMASVAQSLCSEVAVRAAEECIQMLGGIGMTWEHPAHLYLKRALVDLSALGTPEQHRGRLAGLVDLPPA
ncbi:acyl-CoA/acyl-ACP dehydrogenase [Aeromicrobium sp. YC3-14]|nr:acyl-CoA dehydrogenase family protein [Aeromicrobium stalagmiti]NRQ49461.1 acyl-CoA/acyl-ACP dehydrogenase [Aeromicrobium stalagmiti]